MPVELSAKSVAAFRGGWARGCSVGLRAESCHVLVKLKLYSGKTIDWIITAGAFRFTTQTTPTIADYFRHQIAETLAGPNGPKIRASLRHAEPVHIALHVNQLYPPGVPLQSMPPSLLFNLPTLPKELEFRIADHDLVLHDIAANLVVDFIPGAIPSS